MTRSRTDTSVETATSVSATAVTTSMTLALPDAIATVWASDLRPTSSTPPIASLSTALKDCPPPASEPLPAPPVSVKPWLEVSFSGLEDVERALDHPARGADDVEIGLVRSLRLAHVGHFDQRIDVGIFDVAGRVRRRIARLMFDSECGLIGPDLAQRHHLRIQRAIEGGGKGRHLAAIGVAAGGRRRGIRVGDIFRDYPHPPRLCPQARGRDTHRPDEVIRIASHDAAPLPLSGHWLEFDLPGMRLSRREIRFLSVPARSLGSGSCFRPCRSPSSGDAGSCCRARSRRRNPSGWRRLSASPLPD